MPSFYRANQEQSRWSHVNNFSTTTSIRTTCRSSPVTYTKYEVLPFDCLRHVNLRHPIYTEKKINATTSGVLLLYSKRQLVLFASSEVLFLLTLRHLKIIILSYHKQKHPPEYSFNLSTQRVQPLQTFANTVSSTSTHMPVIDCIVASFRSTLQSYSHNHRRLISKWNTITC